MDNMSSTSVSYSERLARMEEKILMLDTKIDTLISQLNKYTPFSYKNEEGSIAVQMSLFPITVKFSWDNKYSLDPSGFVIPTLHSIVELS